MLMSHTVQVGGLEKKPTNRKEDKFWSGKYCNPFLLGVGESGNRQP